MIKTHALINGIDKGPDAVATQRAFRQLDDTLNDLQAELEAELAALSERVDGLVAGTGVVTSVSAGNSMVSVAPTTGNVVVNVAPSNFTGIPESGVTNLLADLASKAALVHTHPESDITGLVADLAGKLSPSAVSGTANKIAKFTGTNSVGDSIVTDNGTTVSVAGALSASGNATLGVFNTGNTQTLYGNISLNAGGIGTTTCFGNFTVGSGNLFTINGAGVFTPTAGVVPIAVTEPSNANGINVSSTATAQTVDIAGLQVSLTGSHNATAAARAAYGGKFTVSESRSAGANALTNYGVYANVTNGQTNYSFYGAAGTMFNAGDLTVNGSGIVGGNLQVNGNYIVGGTLTVVAGTVFQNTVTANMGIFTTLGAGIVSDGGVEAKFGYAVGSPATSGYILLGIQRYTASGTYTPTPNTRYVRVRMVGGGAAGGGTSGAASNAAGASGGSSGQYIEVSLSANAITSYAVTIGAAGAAPAAGANPGGGGGNTQLVITTDVTSFTYNANGGAGGAAMAAGTALAVGLPTPVPALSATTVDFSTAEPGGFGIRGSGSVAMSGNGGSSPLGVGGAITASPGNGQAARGFGSGGSGSVSTTTNQAGGAGTPGLVIIEEHG